MAWPRSMPTCIKFCLNTKNILNNQVRKNICKISLKNERCPLWRKDNITFSFQPIISKGSLWSYPIIDLNRQLLTKSLFWCHLKLLQNIHQQLWANTAIKYDMNICLSLEEIRKPIGHVDYVNRIMAIDPFALNINSIS